MPKRNEINFLTRLFPRSHALFVFSDVVICFVCKTRQNQRIWMLNFLYQVSFMQCFGKKEKSFLVSLDVFISFKFRRFLEIKLILKVKPQTMASVFFSVIIFFALQISLEEVICFSFISQANSGAHESTQKKHKTYLK